MKTAFSGTEVHVDPPQLPRGLDPQQVRDTLMGERRSSGEDNSSSFGISAEVQGPDLADMDRGSPEPLTSRRDAEPEPPHLDSLANVR